MPVLLFIICLIGVLKPDVYNFIEKRRIALTTDQKPKDIEIGDEYQTLVQIGFLILSVINLALVPADSTGFRDRENWMTTRRRR